LDWDGWHELADRLRAASIRFLIEPHIRFQGEVGGQATLFILDPSGNALEFKSFKDSSQVFARPECCAAPELGRQASLWDGLLWLSFIINWLRHNCPKKVIKYKKIKNLNMISAK